MLEYFPCLCKPELLGSKLIISRGLRGCRNSCISVQLKTCNRLMNLKDVWLCRSGLRGPVKERRTSAAGGDERGDRHVHHQGRAARGWELRLCRWDSEKDQWPGQPTAGVQPLGGKKPNPSSFLVISGCASPQGAPLGVNRFPVWLVLSGPAWSDEQDKADGIFLSRLEDLRLYVLCNTHTHTLSFFHLM